MGSNACSLIIEWIQGISNAGENLSKTIYLSLEIVFFVMTYTIALKTFFDKLFILVYLH